MMPLILPACSMVFVPWCLPQAHLPVQSLHTAPHCKVPDAGSGFPFTLERSATDPRVLTATLSQAKSGEVLVSITSLSGSLLAELSFPTCTQATISELEANLQDKLNLKWTVTTFLSDDGRTLKRTDYLRDNSRLTLMQRVQPFIGERHNGIHHLVNQSEDGSWNHYIIWIMDSETLKRKKRGMISGQFQLPLSELHLEARFVMMLHPRPARPGRGGDRFSMSEGWGKVEVKCLSDVFLHECSATTFRLMLGPKDSEVRGPVAHNFSVSSVAPQPRQMDHWWDLSRTVDPDTHKLIVCLEVQNLMLDGGKEHV